MIKLEWFFLPSFPMPGGRIDIAGQPLDEKNIFSARFLLQEKQADRRIRVPVVYWDALSTTGDLMKIFRIIYRWNLLNSKIIIAFHPIINLECLSFL